MARPQKSIEQGTKFGRLTFIKDAFIDDKGKRFAVFNCECGNENIVTRLDPVRAGKCLSCGCLRGGVNYFELIPETEKQQIKELSSVMTIKQLTQKFKHDRITIHKILGIEKPKEQTEEGFFDVDEFFKSDFILQA